MTKKKLLKKWEDELINLKEYQKEFGDILKIASNLRGQKSQLIKCIRDLKNLDEEPVSDKVLIDFAKWLETQTITGLLAMPEYYVQRYLKSINSAERIPG